MKRIILIIAAIVATTLSLNAQEVGYREVDIYNAITEHAAEGTITVEPQVEAPNIPQWKNNIRVGIGVPGVIPMLIVGAIGDADSGSTDTNTMSDVLANYRYYWDKEIMTPGLSAEYAHAINDWFWLGAKFSTLATYRNRRHVITDDVVMRRYTVMFSYVINARFEWLRRENVQMYSTIGLGAAHLFGNERMTVPFYETTYVGLSVGRGFYAYFEVGNGVSGMFRSGLGCRF